MDRKTAPARHITQERLISLDLIQDNCDRSQKERDRQTNEILSDLTKGAQIEAGRLTLIGRRSGLSEPGSGSIPHVSNDESWNRLKQRPELFLADIAQKGVEHWRERGGRGVVDDYEREVAGSLG